MRSRSSVLLVATLTALLTACADSSSITASTCPCFPAATPPTAAVNHGAATVYVGPDSLYGKASRFILYEDGTFVLQIDTGYSTAGRFTRAGSVITFIWDVGNGVGPWGASAVLSGDDLTVTYNLAMAVSDFENGTYRRQP